MKDTQGLVPLRGFSRLRLIILGEKALADGADIAKIVEERLGLPTELYEPLADELHGPASLPPDRRAHKLEPQARPGRPALHK